MYDAVIEAGVIDDSNNHSGHLPIFTKLSVGKLNLVLEEQERISKPSWDKANQDEREQYKRIIQQLLSDIVPPNVCDNCDSFKCETHAEEVEDYATSICDALDKAAHQCLPLAGGVRPEKSKRIPGWTEYVKPYQDESVFWHGMWGAAGKPNIGELYRLKQETKMQYKYAVRRLKRASYNIQKDKLLNGFLKGGVDIFKEIKKFRGKTCTISSSVDGKVGSADISAHFADVYRDLYQRHNLDNGFNEINQLINSKINQNLNVDLEKVNNDTVRAALRKLKTGKSDSSYSFTSDCLLNAGDELISHVTSLFKWFLRTGRIPMFLLICNIIPIVKDNLGDITSSDNYRAIAIGSLILKWFDWIIIILEENNLSTDELQFGFKAGSSTSMCSWAISTVINYYNRAGRPVYACSMDLSKAFDLVSWDNLFSELLDRGISPLILRCLTYIYSNQTYNVKWGNIHSQEFKVHNGVRQGAVSSPVLFCVYINKLITLLRSSKVGCQLQGVYFGIWVYADDIILLSPSREGLQSMTRICEQFALDFNLKFSTNVDVVKSKTKCIIFSNPVINHNHVCPIMLNGVPLPYVNEIKHLGNILQSDNSMAKDCSQKRAQFISKLHSLNQEFHFSDPCTVVKLYNIYACNLYGSNLWDLYDDKCDKLYKSWNVCIRILFNLPRNTHRYLIEPISGVFHVKTLLCSRFVQFYKSLIESSKLSVRLLAYLSRGDFRTVFCKNINNIADECNISVSDLCKNTVKRELKYFHAPEDQLWRIPLINELIDFKDNKYEINGFDLMELTDLINFLCSD